jgi:hypothetical protein
MADVPISQEEIDNLAQQLEGITGDNERALLSGIVAVAAQAIRGAGTDGPAESLVTPTADQDQPVVVRLHQPLPSFRDQIAQAFTPGALDEPAGIKKGQVMGVRIGPHPRS